MVANLIDCEASMAQGLERPWDVVGGLVVVAIGAGFFAFGRELEAGTSFRMGPGYFPAILSLLMVALGAVMTVLAWRAPQPLADFAAASLTQRRAVRRRALMVVLAASGVAMVAAASLLVLALNP